LLASSVSLLANHNHCRHGKWQRAESLPTMRPNGLKLCMRANCFYDPMALPIKDMAAGGPLSSIRGCLILFRAGDPRVQKLRSRC